MQQKNKFNCIIIGFGKGGKTLAATLGLSGKKTALIEKSCKMYGGTCINVGCIPTKFLVHKSEESKFYKDKQAFYKDAIDEELRLVEKLRLKNLEKLQSSPNVTVITGTAKFLSKNLIEVQTENGIQVLEGEYIFINTGAVPFIPSIEGIKENRHVVTSEGLLKQTKLPEKLVIIGGGYIGVEFASIYANFGSNVTIIQNESIILPREDEDIVDYVCENFESRGIEILTNVQVLSVAEIDSRAVITVAIGKVIRQLFADVVLVATGRIPNTVNLGLENADVQLTERGGIVTDEHLCTTTSNIYAMGDVIGGLQFTYISLDDFRIVRSAFLGDGSYTIDKRGVIPYSVFIDPPFSCVGMSEKEAKEKGYSVKISKILSSAIPKAIVDEKPYGILKAVIDEETDFILGAHFFCEQSYEIINIVKIAMDTKLTYKKLRDMIFTHPTISEVFNDLFNI